MRSTTSFKFELLGDGASGIPYRWTSEEFCSFTIRAMIQRSVTNAKTWFVRQYTKTACATVTITTGIELVIIGPT